MKRGEGRGRAPAAALLPLPACEPGCFACIVLHRKAFVLAAAHACRCAAASLSPDVLMPFLSDPLRAAQHGHLKIIRLLVFDVADVNMGME